jgi:hypothetical protein
VLRTAHTVPTDPKAPAAGTTVSKLAANDAAQLKSLLGIKAAVDGSNILKGEWTPSGEQCLSASAGGGGCTEPE